MPLTPTLAQMRSTGVLPELAKVVRGIEKESLRVDPTGYLAQTPHPQALGSALCHGSITTDYSEALLEFITGASPSIATVLKELEEIHSYTYQQIGDELLWVNSMPCQLGTDSDIPVGLYGSSNTGRMKTVYRVGLGHRYGRLMQTIAGIHYNFSLPDTVWEWLRQTQGSTLSAQDFKTEGYFAGIRNFRRYFWLLLYLFGAAPAVCRSFVRGRQHNLQPVGSDDHSLHSPYATSLRMGDLGYQSDAQSSLIVCYNGIDNYVETLLDALNTPYPAYEDIGVKDSDGQYKQLNTHLLQIENEFYSPIRPKRTAGSGEAPINALRERGVEYLEVRCLDLNPLVACGIDEQTTRVVDTFLVYCLLSDSPRTHTAEYREILENQRRTVRFGRDPELRLQRGGEEIALRTWGAQILEEMRPVAEALDEANGGDQHRNALNAMFARIDDAALTPSAEILRRMRNDNKTYFRLAMELAERHRDYFLAHPPSEETSTRYRAEAEASLLAQRELEAAPAPDFEQFLDRFYAQYREAADNLHKAP